MNYKNRKVQTLYEKYGDISVKGEYSLKLEELSSKLDDELEIFNQLPYVGFIYIPIKHPFVDLLDDFEIGEMVKLGVDYKRCKIISVDEYKVEFCYWDDHHKHINRCYRDFNLFNVCGNEIILRE